MKNIALLLVIGFLGVGLSGCVGYDDGYYYGGPDVGINLWDGGGGWGWGWGGGHHHGGHGWHGGHGGGGHVGHGGHGGHGGHHH